MSRNKDAPPALLPYAQPHRTEAGCDEAGRGCLAGPVFAAAVIWPADLVHPLIRDSKQLTAAQRITARALVEEKAVAWAVGQVAPTEIDELNILRASFVAMHRALDQLHVRPDHLLIDGNRFVGYQDLPFDCVIKGDSKYLSIAAASILAKTHRDDYMATLHTTYPQYAWDSNKGYPTGAHRTAIATHGATVHHRHSFRLLPVGVQMALFEEE